MAAPFKLSVFTDEISPDLEHALDVARNGLGLGYVELRSAWGRNVMAWDARDVAEARGLLERFRLRVSSIAGPLFKVDWPGAPTSPHSPRDQFGADYVYEQQDEVLQRGLELARVFRTPHLRCFDFWRLDDPAPFRAAMDDRLRAAAAEAAKRGITLVMENEYACNTATGAEAARTMKAVAGPGLQLNWDPGNSAFRGETPFPDAYRLIPPGRIGHVHVKDVVKKPEGGFAWMEVGQGLIDFAGQFRALARDGYRGFIVLETHWRGGHTAEEATRRSMAGLVEALRNAGTL
ncbi:MAG TPA: sugar phosphate isomerase/epimerase family protein [Vicinamibacteria bacterium]|nr:sugar phosphate isomerase/epimerase family protein [Vicinamibacteria bacterium]